MTSYSPGLLACALIVTGLAACSDPSPHAARTPTEHALPTLQVHPEPLALHYQTVGSVVSDERVEISSRLAAYVRAINVREGEAIRRGQVLVQLDARAPQAAVRQRRKRQHRGAGEGAAGGSGKTGRCGRGVSLMAPR